MSQLYNDNQALAMGGLMNDLPEEKQVFLAEEEFDDQQDDLLIDNDDLGE